MPGSLRARGGVAQQPTRPPGRAGLGRRTLRPDAQAGAGELRGRGCREREARARPDKPAPNPAGNRERAAGTGAGPSAGRGGAARPTRPPRGASITHPSSARPGHSRELVAPGLQKEPGGGERLSGSFSSEGAGKTAAAFRLQASDSNLYVRSLYRELTSRKERVLEKWRKGVLHIPLTVPIRPGRPGTCFSRFPALAPGCHGLGAFRLPEPQS